MKLVCSFGTICNVVLVCNSSGNDVLLCADAFLLLYRFCPLFCNALDERETANFAVQLVLVHVLMLMLVLVLVLVLTANVRVLVLLLMFLCLCSVYLQLRLELCWVVVVC